MDKTVTVQVFCDKHLTYGESWAVLEHRLYVNWSETKHRTFSPGSLWIDDHSTKCNTLCGQM